MGSAREVRCVTAYDVRGANPGTGQVGRDRSALRAWLRELSREEAICLSMRPSVTAQATCASIYISIFPFVVIKRIGVSVD